MEISYLDFGKPFPNDIAGEFVELAYTRKFANNPTKERNEREAVLRIPLRTTAEEKYRKGEGVIAVVCKPTRDQQIQFSLVQPRSEDEFKRKLTGRFFFQRRHMLVKQHDLIDEFRKGNQPFVSLFETGCGGSQDEVTLIKYLKPKNEVPTISDHEFVRIKSDRNNSKLIENGKFVLPKDILLISNAFLKTCQSGKNQVRIIGKLTLREKLKIVDAVQRLVYHKIGWICFATDYVSETVASDACTLLFLETEQESNVVPAPTRGFNLVEDIRHPYFDRLQEINGEAYNIVNRALFDKECNDVEDIMMHVKGFTVVRKIDFKEFLILTDKEKRELIRRYPTEAIDLLSKCTSFIPFLLWLDYLSDIQEPSSELVKNLLWVAKNRSAFPDQLIDKIHNRKTWEILQNAFEKGKKEELQFILKQLQTTEHLTKFIPKERLEEYVSKYIERFDYDSAIYKFLLHWSKKAPIGKFTLYAGLVAAIATDNVQDFNIWVEKSKGKTEEVNGGIEFLHVPYNRKGNPQWIQVVVKDILDSVRFVDQKTKELLRSKLEKYNDPAIMSEPEVNEQKHGDELEQIREVEKRFNNLSDNGKRHVLKKFQDYETPQKREESPIYKDYEEPKGTPFSLQSVISSFTQSLRWASRQLFLVISFIVLVLMVINFRSVISALKLTETPNPTELSTELFTENTSTSVTPVGSTLTPEVTFTPEANNALIVTNLPIGLLVFNAIQKNDEGDTIHPIYFLSSEIEVPQSAQLNDIAGGFSNCINAANKEPFLSRWSDQYLVLSMAVPCEEDIKIAAKILLEQGSFLYVEKPQNARNAIISFKELLVANFQIVTSSQLINEKYVSFLTGKDKTTFWIVHDLQNPFAVFSFQEEGNDRIKPERETALEAPKSSAYNIISYEWVNNNSALLLLERNNVYRWTFLPFSLEKLDIDLSESQEIMYSPQGKPVVDFSLNKERSIALVYLENEQNYFQFCRLNEENRVSCENEPVFLNQLNEVYQIMWSPDNKQIALTASTLGMITIKDNDNLVQMDCLNGCLFLANTNRDGSLGELQLVRNISGINYFWWIDPTIIDN